MRCYSCNKLLLDFETRLKGAISKQYLDMCKKCIDSSGISVLGVDKDQEFEVGNEIQIPLPNEEPYYFIEDEE